jgi:hypothetical protein
MRMRLSFGAFGAFGASVRSQTVLTTNDRAFVSG